MAPEAGRAWHRALPRVRQLLSPYLRSRRWPLLGSAVAAAALSLSILPVLWLVRAVFDRALPQRDFMLLLEIGAAVIVVRLATMLLSLLLRRRVIEQVKGISLALREDLLARIYTRTREGMTRAEIDRLQGRIVQESERVDVFLNLIFSQVLPAAFTALALLVFLTWQSTALVAVAALVIPGLWLAGRLTQRAVARNVERFQAAFEVFNKGVSFVLRQIDLTRTQGAEGAELARRSAQLAELAAAGRRMAYSFALHGNLQNLVTGVAGIVLLVFGGVQVIQGAMTLGQLLVFYFGATLLNSAFGTVSRASAELIAARVSLDKLAELLRPDAGVGYDGHRTIEFRGAFSLRDIHVAYDRETVLQGVDLDIEPGDRIAIVGPNGSGKSTLLLVLLGLLRPARGEVCADGVPYAELDTSALRRQLGVVQQRNAPFFGSVRDNLCYGIEGVSQPALEEAARLAGAHAFIAALPQGYDTPVGDGGMALSGGECQRIAIARALLRRPRALILDEPTNHLDVVAVAELMTTLRSLLQAPTLILVSHDERLLELAERRFRLHHGRLQPLALRRPQAAESTR